MSPTVRTCAFFYLAWAALAPAQEHSFPLSGRVTDSSGAAVPGASITLYSRSTAESYVTAADNQGNYSVTVPRGQYLLQAEAPGLRLSKAPVAVDVSGPQTLPLRLAVGELRDAVEVTATGTPQSLDETAKAVDVIGRAEMEQRGDASLTDALREVPGLRVEQRGGPGVSTTVQIRGLRTFDTAVLIDGMRFRDVGATQGDASSFLTDLLLVDTARVEVLQGPRAPRYMAPTRSAARLTWSPIPARDRSTAA